MTTSDVAKRAGVSQAAVSRALTGRGYISEEKKERVIRAARELGFQPNAIARSLITKTSGIIAIVVADLRYSFYITLIHELSQALRAQGYQGMLVSLPYGEEIDGALSEVIAYRVDGIVIASARLSSKATEMCREGNIPTVLINRDVVGSTFGAVTADNIRSGKLAAAFLLAGGHRRLAFVAGMADTSPTVDRETGFCDEAARLSASAGLRRDGHSTYEGGYRAVLDLMGLDSPPDAICCASDIMAIGAMDAIRHRLGLRVPEDVSITGFVNADIARWESYRLTSISVDPGAMSQRAVRMLTDLIRGKPLDVTKERLMGRLVIRESARLPSPDAMAKLKDYDIVWDPPFET